MKTIKNLKDKWTKKYTWIGNGWDEMWNEIEELFEAKR